jgi:hypothetical protein
VENSDITLIENKKSINCSFYILIICFIQVIISDIIIYFSGIQYVYAQLITLVINIILNKILIKKELIKIKCDFEKFDLIFLILFSVIFLLTVIFPDEFYDSYSYHIYFQKNAFVDKIFDDFFPGRTLTTYTYPIVDRLYCLFSNKLGFRLGVIPSYYVLIVIYYQIKKILKTTLLNTKVDSRIICILSILPMCAFIVLQQVGTYYIDNICIALLMEFTYIILYERKNLFKNKIRLYFLALLVGISVSAKITNGVYILLPLIIVLLLNIKDIKYLKWYDYILLLCVGILPVFVYMLDAIIDTGSPVFPYYNSIFKSKYFAEYDWTDTDYGAKNWFQLLIWPIYITIYPNRGYNLHETDYNFLYGYIISIAYLIYVVFYKIIYGKIRKEKIELNIDNVLFSLIILYYNFVLVKFCMGYTRYGGIIPIISGVFIIKLLIDAYKNNKILLVILFSYMICSSTIIGITNFWYSGKMTYYNGILSNTEAVLYRVKVNAKCVLKDQDYLKYDIDGIWGVIGDDSAVPSMLTVDDPIVQLRSGVFSGETEESKEIYMNNILNNDIYVPIYEMKLKLKLMQLDENNFEITDIVDVIPNVLYMLDARPVYILKVKYNENRSKSNYEIYDSLLYKFYNNN